MWQLIFILTPLLLKPMSETLLFVWVTVNFITIADYKSYNFIILDYLCKAIKRLNILKEFFYMIQSINKKTEKEYFNFLK